MKHNFTTAPQRRTAFRPYCAIVGEPSDPDVMHDSLRLYWIDQVRGVMERNGWLNPLSYYQRLLDGLGELDRVTVAPLSEAATREPGKVRVALRHDIDAGLWSAVDLARMLAARGLPGGFFVLHTNSYYGVFSTDRPGLFVRQPHLAGFVRDIAATGCEVGLHHDALGIFAGFGVDGVAAVRGELAWLRSLGVTIRGATAHNGAQSYGAENFEIFRGLNAGDRRRVVTPGGVAAPLGATTLAALGIDYEGNHPLPVRRIDPATEAAYMNCRSADPIRDPIWLERQFLSHPYFQSAYDVDIWLTGADGWFIADRPRRRILSPLRLDDVLGYLRSLPDGATAVVNVHPDYLG